MVENRSFWSHGCIFAIFSCFVHFLFVLCEHEISGLLNGIVMNQSWGDRQRQRTAIKLKWMDSTLINKIRIWIIWIGWLCIMMTTTTIGHWQQISLTRSHPHIHVQTCPASYRLLQCDFYWWNKQKKSNTEGKKSHKQCDIRSVQENINQNCKWQIKKTQRITHKLQLHFIILAYLFLRSDNKEILGN